MPPVTLLSHDALLIASFRRRIALERETMVRSQIDVHAAPRHDHARHTRRVVEQHHRNAVGQQRHERLRCEHGPHVGVGKLPRDGLGRCLRIEQQRGRLRRADGERPQIVIGEREDGSQYEFYFDRKLKGIKDAKD